MSARGKKRAEPESASEEALPDEGGGARRRKTAAERIASFEARKKFMQANYEVLSWFLAEDECPQTLNDDFRLAAGYVNGRWPQRLWAARGFVVTARGLLCAPDSWSPAGCRRCRHRLRRLWRAPTSLRAMLQRTLLRRHLPLRPLLTLARLSQQVRHAA
jgi:hypothetical protein